MPRDLYGRDPKDEATLTASPESQTRTGDLVATDHDGYKESNIHQEVENLDSDTSRFGRDEEKDLSDLIPYVQTLSLTDVESCIALENATFPRNERCSREKVNALHSLWWVLHEWMRRGHHVLVGDRMSQISLRCSRYPSIEPVISSNPHLDPALSCR